MFFRFIELNVVNDFLIGNVFEHYKKFFLKDTEVKCVGDVEDIHRKMLVYLNYMKIVTEDIALMCPVPDTFDITQGLTTTQLSYLTKLLKYLEWQQEFSSIVRELEIKGDVFYQIYEENGIHRYEKLDTLKMKEIYYEKNKPSHYIYEFEDYINKFDANLGKMDTEVVLKKVIFTEGGYYLFDGIEETPKFFRNSELMGDMIPIIHIKSIEQREDSYFSKVPASEYIDPILYLMVIDTDRRATNRQAGFPRIFVVNGEIDDNSSFDAGGVVYVNSLKDYTTAVQPEIMIKSIEITNSLSSLKQELEYVSDWLHRAVGLIPPTLQVRMSSSDSSKAIAQFRIKQEVKNKKYMQNVRDSFSSFFMLKLKENFKKVKVENVYLEIPKLLTTTSAFDKNLLIAQEMGIGMTTINNELQKQGLNEQEIKKHLENVTNEVYQASGKDVSVTQSVSQDNNNLSSTEVTQVDNKFKQ